MLGSSTVQNPRSDNAKICGIAISRNKCEIDSDFLKAYSCLFKRGQICQLFSGIAHGLEYVRKTAKSQWSYVSNFNQIISSLFIPVRYQF